MIPRPIAAVLAAMFCCVCLALAQSDDTRADGAACFGTQCSGFAPQCSGSQCSGPVAASPPDCSQSAVEAPPAPTAAVAAPAPTCACDCPDCTCAVEAAPVVVAHSICPSCIEYQPDVTYIVSEGPAVVHSEHRDGVFRSGAFMQRGPLRRLFAMRRANATARRAAIFGRLANRSSQSHARACSALGH